MDAEHRVMPDGDWIRYVRRRTNNPDYFVYHHQIHNTFVLAAWLDKENRVCMELHAMETPPDRGGWVDNKILDLITMPHGKKMEMAARQRRESEARKTGERYDSVMEKRDTGKWLRSKNMDLEAEMVEGSRYVGDREGQESLARMKDELNSMSKSTSYFHARD